MKESEWRFTGLDGLPERLGRIVRLEASERAIVTCFIDARRGYAMTTARVFGVLHGSRFDCSPLEVTQWRWGNFKHDDRSEVETATLALASGTHIRLAYETGPAAMGPIYYERFWRVEYIRLWTSFVRGYRSPTGFAVGPLSPLPGTHSTKKPQCRP